jgi:hypothetical protein
LISNKNQSKQSNEGSEYASEIAKANVSFDWIWQKADEKVRNLSETEKNALHNSILRGVKVLETEMELYGYLSFYGKMHQAKLQDAFEHISSFLKNHTIEIIDWGCGQGIGTIIFYEYFSDKIRNLKYRHITLIEPSKISLDRACLHTKYAFKGVSMSAVQDDFDNLVPDKLDFDTENLKVHIFSNVLDIDIFSMKKLLKLVSNTSKGANIFICVSPFINDIKTARIDAFVNHFSAFVDFELIYAAENKKWEWLKSWTRVIRVFKVKI